MKLYKVLGEDRVAHHGGTGAWLPACEWMPPITGNLGPCHNGYHLCRQQDLVSWLGPTIWEAEYDGEIVEADDKVVVRKARLVRHLDTWNARTQRLFACDCAGRVLHLYETKYPDDSRVRGCIEIARKVASGDLPVSELAAARGAAWGAAWAAARAAAWDAARGAAGAAAWAVARDAAGAAARAAAWAAAWGAAGDAERKWQTERLFRYLNGEAA